MTDQDELTPRDREVLMRAKPGVLYRLAQGVGIVLGALLFAGIYGGLGVAIGAPLLILLKLAGVVMTPSYGTLVAVAAGAVVIHVASRVSIKALESIE